MNNQSILSYLGYDIMQPTSLLKEAILNENITLFYYYMMLAL